MPGAAQVLDLSGALAPLVGRLDFRIPLRTVALYLNSQARKCFDEQRSPDGKPWARFKRKPSARRGGPSAKLLRNTGILMASLTGQAGGHVEVLTATSLTWGSNVPYAGYHQHGTKHIPARPFLGITDQMRGRIEQIVAEYVKRALG